MITTNKTLFHIVFLCYHKKKLGAAEGSSEITCIACVFAFIERRLSLLIFFTIF
jgi:hypothetical protein